MTTNWVLAAEHEGFPLMYHWRVLPDSTPLPEELADIERAVTYWGGGSQVRRRIQALQPSSASLALFLEYIPQNLHQWLGTQVQAGDETANRACVMVERELAARTSFMNRRGLLHCDAHFEHILTDGQRLYFADYVGPQQRPGHDAGPTTRAFDIKPSQQLGQRNYSFSG